VNIQETGHSSQVTRHTRFVIMYGGVYPVFIHTNHCGKVFHMEGSKARASQFDSKEAAVMAARGVGIRYENFTVEEV
jgi:hypothetical protein